ncbi:double-strand break repair protein MRE11-like isoform X1 [Eucalyptus grandis]|uniref:double-strand break repair protein MRE11-like isoform X1 n=1 Tax=Eucalyptus grandis TaxID=71139 RepID=UPI00192EC784|nr:double-strand break repair protein MRE11-like isoform X1 [Eucalyptus grandis]
MNCTYILGVGLMSIIDHSCLPRFGHVNYEDPHFNVGLLVFSIHGNHDDPAGVNKIARDSDTLKCEEEDLILKVGECLEERVKERSVHPSDTPHGTSSAPSVEAARNRSAAGIGSTVSFSDDEDTAEILGSNSATRGRKGSLGVSRSSRATSDLGRGKTSTIGRGRGRGSANLKQTTLDSALVSRRRESYSEERTLMNKSIIDS